jgi:enoyl-CoA hydratase/carnithine racemase
MTSQEELIFEMEDNVATVTLNLPGKLNALSQAITAGLWQAIDDASADDSIRAMVITGVGRGFCSGADVEGLAAATGGTGGAMNEAPPGKARPEAPSETRSLIDIPAALQRLPIPVLGAINGVAAGGGLSLALACDIRIASEEARFAAVWVKRALMPDLGISYTLPRAVGLSKACEMIFSGDIIDAAEAERIGLVSKVVPPDQLLSTTMELAKRIASGPPMAIQYAKEVIYKAQEMDMVATVRLEAVNFGKCLRSEDAAEGVNSFLEKREPAFKGR